MNLRSLLGATITTMACAPAILRAQSLRGVVVAGADVPVPGVVVILLDSTAREAARALSDASGQYRLAAPHSGTYRVRALRIGFRPTTSAPLVLTAGADVSTRMTLSEMRVNLDTLRITGRNACRAIRDSALATHAVWQQVRTALTAVELTAANEALDATVVAFDRMLDRSGRGVLEQTTMLTSGLVSHPWNSLPADSLHRVGYVSLDEGDVATYQAPGLDVLLSDLFLEDHCFRLVAAPDATEMGIAFEPAPHRKVAEIGGTLWLDRRTSELRRLDYRYVNVERQHQERAGGDMRFVRMKGGQWAIARWSIRMPVLLRGLSSGNESRLGALKVRGGELALALRGNDTLWARPPLVLSGVVTDSITGLPMDRARVSLLGTPLGGVTDTAGRFAIRDVLPGEYTLEVHTASLDSVGAVSQTDVAFSDSADVIRVQVLTGMQLAQRLCGSGAHDFPGIVVGRVENRVDSVLAGGARVVAEWQQHFVRTEGGLSFAGTRPRFLEAQTDQRGAFRLCGVPVDAALIVRAETDSGAGAAELTIPAGGRIARVAVFLDDLPQQVATLTGTVVTDSTNQPIAEVEITIPALGRSTYSDERGAYRLSAIPPGNHQVVARRIGYGPLETQVDFAAREVVQRRIVLSATRVLADVSVVETATKVPALLRFEERMRNKAGGGTFFTRAQLEPREGEKLSRILQQVRGAVIIQTGGRDKLRFGRGPSRTGCIPSMVVDGLEVRNMELDDIRTADVEALEVYTGASAIPSEFSVGGNSGCGVVAIWTRRPIHSGPRDGSPKPAPSGRRPQN